MKQQSSNYNATRINNALNYSNKSTRDSMTELVTQPLFTPVYDMSIRDQKDLALKRLKEVVSKRLVSVKDFRTNPDNIFTMHEMLGFVDGSLATKFTVQFNLFGGTIVGLGTEIHEEFLNKLDELNIVGCFCLTEVGYGNNAIEMETTAVYNEQTKQFVINTPTVNSQKFWITNGAYHANYAAVFAQTIVKGKNEGIHIFLVKMRDENNKPLKGIVIDDMGHKMGLNGIDNARIIFRDVSVPADNMLNRISNINTTTGDFSSLIKGKRARFIYSANRLLSGRLCIGSMTISTTKLALAVTIKYAKDRLSNGKSGKSDTPIFNYQLFQNQVIPLLTRTLIYNVGLLKIREAYNHYILNEKLYDEKTPEKINEIIRLCCCIKPLISWNANEVGNTCRERCGGQGYLSVNLIEAMIYSAHSGITAEGDSVVLMQKVSKEYVEDFVKGVVEIPFDTEEKEFNVTSISIQKDFINCSVLLDLIKVRESILLKRLAEKTITNPKEIYETWMLKEADLIQELALTYGKRYCLEAFEKSEVFELE